MKVPVRVSTHRASLLMTNKNQGGDMRAVYEKIPVKPHSVKDYANAVLNKEEAVA